MHISFIVYVSNTSPDRSPTAEMRTANPHARTLIHIHTPEPDVFSACALCSTLHGAYMGPRTTTTTTPCA
jgi:hypothetical protein